MNTPSTSTSAFRLEGMRLRARSSQRASPRAGVSNATVSMIEVTASALGGALKQIRRFPSASAFFSTEEAGTREGGVAR